MSRRAITNLSYDWLLSPRSRLRIFPLGLACSLERIKLLELIIVAYHAHTAGALFPSNFSSNERHPVRMIGSGAESIDASP